VTDDAEIGWRPTPEKKTLKRCPSLLGQKIANRNTSWSWDVIHERELFPKGASWSLSWPSGVNLLARMQLKYILYKPL
jgi:hypothetical protein